MLNTQKIFEDPKHPSPLAIKALKEIRKNRRTAINRDYLKDYQLLKIHLLRISRCFETDKTAVNLETSQTSDLLNYTTGLLCVLFAQGVK